MNREEYCIAQSVVAAIRIISSMYESDGEEQEIHVGDSRDRIVEFVKKTTTEWQRENAADLLKSLVSQEEGSYQDIKELSEQLGVPIITAIQLNRKGSGDRKSVV